MVNFCLTNEFTMEKIVSGEGPQFPSSCFLLGVVSQKMIKIMNAIPPVSFNQLAFEM